LEWEHSKEFEYKGEFYDVVKSETNGDTTYYWCWWDYEETQLNRKCMELVTISLGNNPQKQKNQLRLFNFFESLYCSEYSESDLMLFDIDQNIGHPSNSNFYKSLLHSPPFPPPESNSFS
ncbi:MAG TPA: hypothetical protein VGF79_10920, partial [Bacteroidia bacterium]